MILHHYSTDMVSMANHSPSDIWFYGPTRNESAMRLLPPLSQSLKINCDSETAEGLPAAQAEINVRSSKDEAVLATGSRDERKSWEQRLSLGEPDALLPMLLEGLIPLLSPSSRHAPQASSWRRSVEQAVLQGRRQWSTATLPPHAKSKTQAIRS